AAGHGDVRHGSCCRPRSGGAARRGEPVKHARWWMFVMVLGLGPRGVGAQEGEFYRDKTVRIIVGTSVGGGFDLYARTLARHLTKHIPGRPTIIVENMSGGGGLVAANHIYRVAKPDGLTVGHFTGDLLMLQVLERPGVDFDARRLEYISGPSGQHI